MLIGPVAPDVRGVTPTDAPFSATIVIRDQNQREVTRVTSAEDGRFRALLREGDYVLDPLWPNPGSPPSANPVKVTVEPGRFTYVEILFDSDIR